MSDPSPSAADWERDADVLARIGSHLIAQPTEVEVRVPVDLADKAIAAWQRSEDDDQEEVDGDEVDADVDVARDRAATLALIGAAIDDNGRVDGDEYVVRLDAWFIGDAFGAASDAGLLDEG